MNHNLTQWQVHFSEQAKNHLKKLEKSIQKRIISYLEEHILNHNNPRLFGSPLKGKLDSYWRYRVGDYHLLCILEDQILTVHAMQIGHRREIYQ